MKRILALDGGGVRGALSVAFIERMEALLADRPGTAGRARLCDHFDLVGGTSTGAIIATALALGMSAEDIRAFYFRLAPRVFRRPPFRLPFVGTRFDSRALEGEIRSIIGPRKLETPDLKTALGIVMKRLDTGSAWIVTNNPGAKYWDDPPDGAFIGNRHYQLADLLRASTAAPYYFAPREVAIVDGEPPGLFVDGGMTPHNNPALALFRIATVPAYGFGWPTGVERLHIVSIGTGSWRRIYAAGEAQRMTAIHLAFQALQGLIADNSVEVLTLMQMLGRSDTPWTINSEIGDLSGVQVPVEPLFVFQRFDVRLERDWLRRELGITVGEEHLGDLRRLDRADNVPLLHELGQAAAERFVEARHLFAPDTAAPAG
jgi:hypothetical protein